MKSNDKLHILMLPSWYLPQGGQFVRNQAQMLCELGVECNVLANVSLPWRKYGFKTLKFPRKAFSSQEDNLLVFRKFTKRIPHFRVLNGLLWTYQTIRLFEKYTEIYGKPDLIHVHSVLWGGYAAYKIKKKYQIPYIITEHRGSFGMSCDYAKAQFVDKENKYMENAFSNADKLIPVSDKLIPHIKNFLVNNVPIEPISNVVNTDFFHYKKREFDGQIKFVAVNGFKFVKAYDVLLPAFDKVCSLLDNVQLTIVGENFDNDDFAAMWKTVKFKNKIKFTGELDAFGVREALWDANIYVLSSRVEAQPVSTLEALSTGLPVVCTSVVPGTVVNEKNAIVVPVENVEAFADAMIQMAQTFREYDGKNISETIKNIASKPVVAKKLLEVYSSILDKRNKR